MASPYVVIAGGICTGKTTLVRGLRQHMHDATSLEEFRGVYLGDYYSSPKEFAFKNQLDYSVQYLGHATRLLDRNGPVFQDRSIFDTHGVFSRTLHDFGWIDAREFAILEELYQIGTRLAKPDIVVLLTASTELAYNRLKTRNIPAERLATREYLDRISLAYDRWFDSFGCALKYRVDTTNLDQASVLRDVASLVRRHS